MKIMTFNLQGFTDWQQRKPNMLTYLQQVQPDIILFQEAVYLPEIHPHNQVHILNQTLNYPTEITEITRLQPSPAYNLYREGLGILSRYSISKIETLALTQAPGDPHQRIIQLVDFVDGDTVIPVAHVHFSLSDPAPDYASAHIQETFKLLESRDEQRIIAGDFNMSDLSVVAAPWKDSYIASSDISSYISQYDAKSTDDKLVDRCTDQIWIPRSYRFTGEIEVSPRNLSDHCAVTAQITSSQ